MLGIPPRMGADKEAIVRATYDAFNAGDYDRLLANVDADVVIRDPDRTGSEFRGHDGYRQFIEEWLESWDDYRVEITELVSRGDRVLVDAVQHGTGKGSRIEISVPYAQVVRLEGDKIVEYQVFLSRADAERAIGT